VNNLAIVSYGGALILLYLCILLYSLACKRGEDIFKNLIIAFGMVPGFIGVIYGFTLVLKPGNSAQGIGVMTAWLLLEMGAIQLKQLIKNNGMLLNK
jgi:hypothetical protein